MLQSHSDHYAFEPWPPKGKDGMAWFVYVYTVWASSSKNMLRIEHVRDTNYTSSKIPSF
jgi:hypothetical protein